MFKLRMLLAVSVFIFFSPLTLSAMECPQVPPAPTVEDLYFKSSWQSVAEPYRARFVTGNDEEPAYGQGYLYLDSLGEGSGYEYWALDVVLPLWSAPGKNYFYGWIQSGRVYPSLEDSPYTLTGAGMVETGYEHSSFIVYEALGDGWLRIRLKPGKDGMVWLHQCHLKLGKAKLTYKGWESFLREHGEWLHFRSLVPHSLREQPDINSPRMTIIGLDHKLELLEVKGNWMRVVVEQPDNSCNGVGSEKLKKTINEGWVKWRDDKQGPWVWVYTRGC